MAQVEEFIIKLKDQFSGEIKNADDALDQTRESSDQLNSSFSTLVKTAGAIGAAMGVSAIIDATKEFGKLQSVVSAYTGQSGVAANDMITNAKTIADTYDVEASRVLEAANTLTKQMGGTMESNLALITQGFRKGANVNGEFLDSLREYPAQFRAAGLSAAESIALITDGAKKGVYSDKAADTIKEMTLSLREMTQIQRDALAGIGIDANKLLSDMNSGAVSPFQAMQKIVGVMDNFDVAAQQTVIADIFKGAGEDAGVQFIKSLKDIDLNLANAKDTGSGFTDVMFDFNMMLNDLHTTFITGVMPVLTSFGSWIMGNIPLLKGIGAAILTVVTALGIMKVATIISTLAAGGFNAVLLANPVMLVVAGIAALIGAFVWAYNEFETFRTIVDGVWQVLKVIGGMIFEIIATPFRLAAGVVGWFIDVFASILPSIMNVMKKVGKFLLENNPVALLIRAVKNLFPEFWKSLTSKFTAAWDWIKKLFNKISSFFGFGGDSKMDAANSKKAQKMVNGANKGSTPTGSLTGGSIAPTPISGSKILSTTKSGGNLNSGISAMSNNAPKQFNINIDKLIENFTVSTQNMEQSRDKIRDIVLETLLGAVNDVQIAMD